MRFSSRKVEAVKNSRANSAVAKTGSEARARGTRLSSLRLQTSATLPNRLPRRRDASWPFFEEHRRNIGSLGRPAASVIRVFEHVQWNPIVAIPAAASAIGMSAPTVAKALDHMRQLGILREITGRRRHRLFVYDAYLAILNEGTEPL
jgi:Fic family protein